MSTSKSAGLPTFSRRQLLQIGATSTAASLFAVKEFAAPAGAKDPPRGSTTTSFVVALPVCAPKSPKSALQPAPTPMPNAAGGECGRLS